MASDGSSKLVVFGVVALSLVAPGVIMIAVAGGRTTSRVMGSLGSEWLAILGVGAGVLLAVGLTGRALVRRGWRRDVVYPLLSVLGMLLCAGAFMLIDPSLALTLVSSAAWIVPMTVASSLIGAGAMQRTGTERFCTRCEYPYIDDPGAQRCPECGANWRAALGTVPGRRHANRRLLWLGGALMALAFLVQIGSALFPGVFMRIAPTSYLAYQAVHTQSFDVAYWAALKRRTLSPELELRLATGLLDARLGGDRWSADDEVWIDGQFRAGALPGPLGERYFAEMVGPPRLVVVPGSTGKDARVEAELRTNLRNTQDARLVVEGWWIDGVFTPTPDTGMVRSTYALEPGRTMTGTITPVGVDLPPAAPGASGGRVSVKFVGWIAVGPFPTVAWQATWSSPPGTPGATPTVPGATNWMRRFDVETVLDAK